MAEFGSHLELAQQYAREVQLSLGPEVSDDTAVLSPEMTIMRAGKKPQEFGGDFYVTLSRLGVEKLDDWSVVRTMYNATLLLGISIGIALERQGRTADFPAEVEVLAKEMEAR